LFTLAAVLAALFLCAMPVGAGTARAADAQPQRLLRHRMATVTTPDVERFVHDYSTWLHYKLRARGRISKALAASWGTPAVAGSRYALLSPDAAPDVFIRAIERPQTGDYRALTTWGWNSIEIIIDQPDALHAKLADSPFRTIGAPAPLGGYPSIRAFQVVGPSQETLYLTAETGDRSKSPLPEPRGDIGRIFIMVVAGPDAEKMSAFYASKFKLAPGAVRQRPVRVVQNALKLDDQSTIGLTTAALAQHGNLIELDGYPAQTGPRVTATDDLPPGIAIASFAVADLGALDLDYVAKPRIQSGKPYDGRRAATAVGEAGELIELIEEPAPNQK